MASLNSLNRNVLRLTGLSSGMDTTSMVESLLKIDQMKVDKQFKTKTQLEWKGDSYRDFNLKIRSFREKFMSVLNPATNIFSGSAFNAFTANMSNPDMSKYVSVTAGSNAQAGAMTIKSIDQLASAAKAASSNMWTTGQNEVVSLDTRFKEAPFATGIDWAVEILPDYDVNPDIMAKAAAGWTQATDAELEALGITRDSNYSYFVDPGDPTNIEPVKNLIPGPHRYVEFSLNGEVFKISENTLMSDMISYVNSKSSITGVTMSYSSLTKGFTFTNRETGADSKVELLNVTGKIFGTGVADGSGNIDRGAFGIVEGVYNGKNAKVTFYDSTVGNITIERNSNNFSIDGVQYGLKQLYDGSEGDITFNVERDIEPVFQKIKGFIEGYNALIEELNNAYTKRPNREYGPLTENEKKQLSEKEAEQWEGFAKEGLLYRDSNIGMLLSTVRGAFYEKVDGVGRTASDIGLRTTPYDYSSGGKITIDEDALRAALASNPEQVKDIFTKVSNSTDSTTKYKESGLVVRISDALNAYVKNVTEISLASNSRQLNAAQDKLEQMERWLLDRENRYWKQFSAMESAMASLQSQSSWIGNMMGGGQ